MAFLVVIFVGMLVVPSASAAWTYQGWISNEYDGHGVPADYDTQFLYDTRVCAWTGDWMGQDTPDRHIVLSSACLIHGYGFRHETDIISLNYPEANWDAIEMICSIEGVDINTNRPNMLVYNTNQWGLMHGGSQPYMDVDNSYWHSYTHTKTTTWQGDPHYGNLVWTGIGVGPNIDGFEL